MVLSFIGFISWIIKNIMINSFISFISLMRWVSTFLNLFVSKLTLSIVYTPFSTSTWSKITSISVFDSLTIIIRLARYYLSSCVIFVLTYISIYWVVLTFIPRFIRIIWKSFPAFLISIKFMTPIAVYH